MMEETQSLLFSWPPLFYDGCALFQGKYITKYFGMFILGSHRFKLLRVKLLHGKAKTFRG